MAESDGGYFLRSQRTPIYNELGTSATFIDEIQNQKTPMCDDRQHDDHNYNIPRHSPNKLLIPELTVSPVRLEDEQKHDISELHSPLHDSHDVRSQQDLQRVPVTQCIYIQAEWQIIQSSPIEYKNKRVLVTIWNREC